MALLYDDPIFVNHDTGAHPECAARVAGVSGFLAQRGLDRRCVRSAWEPVGRDTLGRVHSLAYVDSVARFADRGGGYVETDTAVSTESYRVACSAAGAVVASVSTTTRATMLALPTGENVRFMFGVLGRPARFG